MERSSLLPTISGHAPRCGTPLRWRGSRRAWIRAAALIAVHVLVVVHVAHWKVSGRTMTPLEPSEAMQTLELGYVNAGFLLFVVLLAVTLILGRFFCGWACHVVAYQDLCAWLLERVGVRPRPVRARVLRLVPVAAALYMFVWPSAQRWWNDQPGPPLVGHLTTDNLWKTFPGPWMAALTLLVDGALIVWWMGAKGFCTYGCPYGALFGIADRFAIGRIRVTDACEGCGHCTAVCTSNVRVHHEVATFGMVVDAGCMKCLDCVNSCPKQALYFGFGKPGLVASAKGTLRSWLRRDGSDLSWPEEILTVLVFFSGMYAFRDLYSHVPFLLAIGLSVVAALAAIAGKRLLGRRDFQLQWSRLRVDGRFTRPGWVGLAFVSLFLAFLFHSSLVQFHLRAGERSLDSWIREPSDRALARHAESNLSRALQFGLFADGNVENLLAVFYQRSGRLEEAELHLRRALDAERTIPRLLALSTILLQLDQRPAAHEALLGVLELEPGHAEARRRLQLLEER